MGSGSTMVAAVRTGRRYVGYDLEPEYVAIAEQRVKERARRPAIHLQLPLDDTSIVPPEAEPATVEPVVDEDADFQRRATEEGKAAQAIAENGCWSTPGSRSSAATPGCAASA